MVVVLLLVELVVTVVLIVKTILVRFGIKRSEEKETSIRDRERIQAGEEEETDWEKAGMERREDA